MIGVRGSGRPSAPLVTAPAPKSTGRGTMDTMINDNRLHANKADILKHLDRLFSRAAIDHPDAYVQIDIGDPAGVRPWAWEYFKITKLKDAADFAKKRNAETNNIYVGVNPRSPDIFPGTAATDADILCAYFNFTDHDTQQAIDNLKSSPLPHTFSVTTGKTPNTRAHCYWEREDVAINLKAWSDVQSGMADFFGSDRVIDPRRIMRLAGTVSYPSPKKIERGYVPELVTIRTEYDTDREPYGAVELYKSFPALGLVPSPSAGREVGAGVSNGLSLATYQNVPVDEYTKSIMAGEGEWHNKMIRVVAHWVSRGLTDSEIILMARNFTQPGYSKEDTDREVGKAIQGARSKFNAPEPVNHPGPSDLAVAPTTGHTGELEENDGEIISAADINGPAEQRQWLLENWIAHRTTAMLFGQGGVGKTLLVHQLANCVAEGEDFMDMPTMKMPVLAVLCEDDRLEIDRRQLDINEWRGLHDFTGKAPKDCYLWPRVGHDNTLVTFPNQGEGQASAFYSKLYAAVEKHKGDAEDIFIILDTAADMFGGNENIRREVNSFLKYYIGALCTQLGATVLILAHPSRAGMANKDGLSGSTAWENGVRSRAYLSWADDDDDEIRILSRKKSNYSSIADSTAIKLIWEDGVLVQPTSPDAIDRIEKRAVKKIILDEIESAWCDNVPLRTMKSQDRQAHKVIQKRHPEFKLSVISTAIRDLIDEGFIAVIERKGYQVIERPEWS